jgi:hypothetical protein
MKFENSSFDNVFGNGVRFDAKTLNNQFSNPGYKKQVRNFFDLEIFYFFLSSDPSFKFGEV